MNFCVTRIAGQMAHHIRLIAFAIARLEKVFQRLNGIPRRLYYFNAWFSLLSLNTSYTFIDRTLSFFGQRKYNTFFCFLTTDFTLIWYEVGTVCTSSFERRDNARITMKFNNICFLPIDTVCHWYVPIQIYKNKSAKFEFSPSTCTNNINNNNNKSNRRSI